MKPMYFAYSIVISIYSALICLAGFFIDKARLWCRGKKGQYIQLKANLQAWKDRDILWIHAASYGEFEMSWPLIEKIKTNNPDAAFLVSFYSPSGFENIALDPDDFIKIYLPVDLLFIQKNYLKLVRPKAVFFIKYEYWYNMLRALTNLRIPYYYVGMHLQENSYILKPLFSGFKKLIAGADQIFAHSMESKEILERHGFNNVELFGDMRIQKAEQNLESESRIIEWPFKGNKSIIYGSVSQFELAPILKTVKKLKDYNHIIAPHDVEEIFFERIRAEGIEFSRISKTHKASNNVMVIDNYGELKFLYSQADVAYIGGGFEKGPHNILEALIHKVPVIIGPNIDKYPLARECHKLNFTDIADTPDMVSKLLKNYLRGKNTLNGSALSDYLESKRAKMDLVEKLLEKL